MSSQSTSSVRRPSYRFKLKPYAHQLEAVRFCLSRFKAGAHPALLMEPRTGKSKTTVDVIGCLKAMNPALKKVLIIAPNRVLGTWVEEIHNNCPYLVHTHVWDSTARKHPIPDASPYDIQFLIVNFEAFATRGTKLPNGKESKTSGRHKVLALLKAWLAEEPAICVVDESHKIKSPSGKAASMIARMGKLFKYRMILTGTPVTKASRIHDIYQQWKFLNPERFRAFAPTLADFKSQTGIWVNQGSYDMWVREIPTGIARVKELMGQDSVIVTRAECFDLPPREDITIPVALTSKTLKHYDEMAEEMITKIKEGVIAEASIPLVVTLRLLQITSGFVVADDQTIHRIGQEKLAALGEILDEDIIEKDQKVVIAARFKQDMDAIVKLCHRKDIPVWQIRGGIKRAETDLAIRAFKSHTPDQHGPAAMIIQPQAASLGIDLSTASNFIWYSLTHSWVDYTQATDRVALSRTSTTIRYLVAPNTVDAMVLDILQRDGEVSKAILAKPEILRRSS